MSRKILDAKIACVNEALGQGIMARRTQFFSNAYWPNKTNIYQICIQNSKQFYLKRPISMVYPNQKSLAILLSPNIQHFKSCINKALMLRKYLCLNSLIVYQIYFKSCKFNCYNIKIASYGKVEISKARISRYQIQKWSIWF